MWPFQTTRHSKRNFVNVGINNPIDISPSSCSRPNFVRLDSTGENFSEEDIPVVLPASAMPPTGYQHPPHPHMRGHHHNNGHTCSHHAGTSSHRYKPLHSGLNQGFFGFHQTTPTTQQFNHNTRGLYQSQGKVLPQAQPYLQNRFPFNSTLGAGNRFMSPVEQSFCGTLNAPFQFGAGMEYTFNPQMYPWSMLPSGPQISASASPSRHQSPQATQNVHHTHPGPRPQQRHHHHRRQQQQSGRQHQKQHCDNTQKRQTFVMKNKNNSAKDCQPDSNNMAAACEKLSSGLQAQSGHSCHSDAINDLTKPAISSESDALTGKGEVGSVPGSQEEGQSTGEVTCIKPGNVMGATSSCSVLSSSCDKKSVVVSVSSFFDHVHQSPPVSPTSTVVTTELSSEKSPPSSPTCTVVTTELSSEKSPPVSPTCTVVTTEHSSEKSPPSSPTCTVVTTELSSEKSPPSSPTCTVVTTELSSEKSPPSSPTCTVVTTEHSSEKSPPSSPTCTVLTTELSSEKPSAAKSADCECKTLKPEKLTGATGLESELDVIKDTFLQCDNYNAENTDSGLGKESSESKEVVPARKNVHLGSFRIHAIVSPSNSSNAVDDSIAGVHRSSPRPSTSAQPQQFSARVFLTPKAETLTGVRRKKSRPSSKKRRRQKSQRSENQSLPPQERTKKLKTKKSESGASPGIPIPSKKQFAFYVDVSDSQECESDVSSPLKASPEVKSSPQSPRISKFAFVIRPSEDSDYSDDSDSSSFSESDDDGFDEDDGDEAGFDEELWNSFNITCSFSPCTSGLLSDPVTGSESDSKPPESPETPECEVRPCIIEANQRWDKLYPDADNTVTPRKVLFAEKDLTTVYTEEADLGEDYQAARKGPWVEYAIDRCRFRNRIQEFQPIIEPYLQTDHRESVFKKYHVDTDN